MLHPWPQVAGYVEDDDRRRPRPDDRDVEQAVLRDRSVARLRARLHAAVRPRHRPGHRGDRRASPPGVCHGAKTITTSIRQLLDHRLRIGIACEDLPEEHNRVTLDPVLKDSHGIPAPRIDYTISENTRRMMEHGIARAEEILTAAGASDILHRAPIAEQPGSPAGHRADGRTTRNARWSTPGAAATT